VGGDDVASSPGEQAVEAVLKPLEFAARDDFAHLERVRDLETAVAAAAERGLELSIPHDLSAALRAVRDAFAKRPAPESLRGEIERALKRLRPFAEPDYGERALATTPAILPGLGPKRAEALAKRGLGTIRELLFQLPSRYDDRRALVRVADLEVGRRATFIAHVLGCGFGAWRGRGAGRGGRLFEAVVGDASGTVELKWFRGGDAISRVVRKDELLLVTGDVKRYRFSKEIQHPEVDVLEAWADASEGAGSAAPRRVVPDYTAPEGLHPRGLRRAVQRAVAEYADLVPAYLPEALVRSRALPTPSAALHALHAPAEDADVDALRAGSSRHHERLILEELYLLELGLALRRAQRARFPGIPIEKDGPRTRAALRDLPFELTGAQLRAWQEIRSDLARPHPMSRLLEGDVGCGKTVLAFLAAVAVAEAGHQTALMAPTELLAEQHHRTLKRLAQAEEAAHLRLELLTASQTRTHIEAVRAELAAGGVDLVVGTHALLQEGVGFRSLGLVVVDEQQRFGVLQRAALQDKTRQAQPHALVMTATPIPRTLALTLYGDLDLSVIDELPPGRRPARTLLMRAGEGRQVAQLLRETVARGEQAYVVYPLVEESEKIDLRAASDSAERIRAAFPDLSVDLVHGRLDASARNAAMARFERGETDVLVSTTVIEVGVDVPNATLMIVEHAERFGLAQLHQLRGRIGRGERPGTCVLVARGAGQDSEARIAALLESSDGFAIAEADLHIRGPGEFLGTRQHGRLPDLHIADLARDVKLVAVARETALETVRCDPELRRDAALARAVRARWGERLALAGVG
jgi:ATP-dependent DNA helicase RecG